MATPRRLAHCLFLLHVLCISNAFVINTDSSIQSRSSQPSRQRPPAWPAGMGMQGVGLRSTSRNRAHIPTALRLSSTSPSSSLPDVEGMKIGEIRAELESYGISTKAFLEKKEMVAELVKARAEGKRPVKSAASSSSSAASSTPSAKQQSTTGSSASSSPRSSGGGGTTSTSSDKSASRDDRVKEEMAKASSMSVSDLKKELTRMGVSTKSFFEKSEFVKAYAEAVVDGAGVNANTPNDSEPYDPEYRDVIMQKMGRTDPRLLQGTVIDISLTRR